MTAEVEPPGSGGDCECGHALAAHAKHGGCNGNDRTCWCRYPTDSRAAWTVLLALPIDFEPGDRWLGPSLPRQMGTRIMWKPRLTAKGVSVVFTNHKEWYLTPDMLRSVERQTAAGGGTVSSAQDRP